MMACFKFSVVASTFAIMLVLVFQSSIVKADFNFNYSIPPGLSPFIDNLCDDVNCGKGKCSVDRAKPFNFVCQCDSGWRQTRFDKEDDLQFLPCVIPNCSLDYSCMPAPPPAPPIPYNISFFDPCYWAYCGEGTCNMNHTYRHTCDCNPGYSNIMNISHFPCMSSCAIGSDCSSLGVRVLDTNSPTGGSNQGGDSNQGNKILHGGFYWIGITVMSVAMALWN
ncbi:uncharacterized protein [Rutidosis leptorrhynchoides]|uniref:uncharacterized protein n=1 Tax=Rutidosis leptorrhynchoides TaxID=125765 RepID=UPI003A9A4EAE